MINYLTINYSGFKTNFPQSFFNSLKEEQRQLIYLYKNSKSHYSNYGSIIASLQDTNLKLLKIAAADANFIYNFQFLSISLTKFTDITMLFISNGLTSLNLFMVNPCLGRLAPKYNIQGVRALQGFTKLQEIS